MNEPFPLKYPTENEVCESVYEWFKANGFDGNWRKAGRPGFDIDVTHDRTKQRWVIEAKGATSSFAGSKRHGQPYGQNGAYSGVSQAFWMACHWTSRPDLKDANLGIAIPTGKHFDNHLKPVERVCDLVGITIFRVHPDLTVEMRSADPNFRLSEWRSRPASLSK